MLRGKNGLRFLVPSLKETVAFELLINGVYESETLTAAKRYLRSGDYVIDVGANVGAFALPVAAVLGPNGRVFAIEASNRVFAYLQSNIKRNGLSNVLARHAVAASQEGGELTFFDAPIENFGMGSRVPWDTQTGYSVPAVRVDSMMSNLGIAPGTVRLLKIDVEGFELDVLLGAAQLLNQPAPPIVIFEFVDWAERRAGFQPGDAQKYLLDSGFALYTVADRSVAPAKLLAPLTEGGHMLIAIKQPAADDGA